MGADSNCGFEDDEEVIHEYMRILNVSGQSIARAFLDGLPENQRSRVTPDINLLVATRAARLTARRQRET
ncbi:MAG: hypothetical protein CMI53_04680 [Parcubacteria group bacterium]|jgi:hypothetical protein|nr:hypothetical protein [Parcubacteria group bacterium]|tara:strand:+ start:133 stop:342 length:210 start_codon:yes stop_codon:yes gene_type:complete